VFRRLKAAPAITGAAGVLWMVLSGDAAKVTNGLLQVCWGY